MAACPPAHRGDLSSLLSSEKRRQYSDLSRNNYWTKWCRFTDHVGQNPYLHNLQGASHYMERSDLFMAFACSLRNGQLHESKGASATTIEATLRECAGIMVAREFADPRRHHPAQPQLDTRFRQQFKQWKDEDPTPKPEHALPNSTVQLLARSYSASPHIKFRIIADLIIVA